MFVCTMNFVHDENGKNWSFSTFQTKPAWVRVISSSILYVNAVLDKFQW